MEYSQLRIVLRTDFMDDVTLKGQLKEDLIAELSHVCASYRGVNNTIILQHEGRSIESIEDTLKNFYSKNLDKILCIRDFQHSSLTKLPFICYF